MIRSIFRTFFEIVVLTPARVLYRQRILHADRVPETGGVLLLANHTTYIDSFLIYSACPRPVRFVIVSRFMSVKAFGWFLRLFGAIPIELGKPRDAIRKTAEALAEGDVVCIFPEGQLTRTGTLLELKKGFEVIAKRSGAQVVPMFLDGLWDSIYSAEGGRAIWKWPRRFPCPVQIGFGHPAVAEDATLDWARSEMLELSAETFSARQELSWSLEETALRSLKQWPGATCFVEHGKRRRKLNRGQVLAIALVLGERWKESLPGEESRIGILLPPGWTPSLINLALVFAGRVPINLPFHAGSFDSEELAGKLHELGIQTVVTSKAFASGLAEFTWQGSEGQFIDMGGELNSTNLVRVMLERLLARLEPKWLAVRRLGFKNTSEPEREAACGYLSGDSREPVLLAPRTVIANAFQLTAGEFVRRHERIFCEAPLTSATGMAFALWLPLIRGTVCTGRSFALQEGRSMIETVVHEEEVTLLIGREALVDQLEKVKDPWHPELREAIRALYYFPEGESDPTLFRRSFDPVESIIGAPVCVGWAPDSIGMVLSASIPDSEVEPDSNRLSQAGRLEDSVGRLLPAITPATAEGGLLVLNGACFASDDPVSTGWRAQIDREGFLFLENKDAD